MQPLAWPLYGFDPAVSRTDPHSPNPIERYPTSIEAVRSESGGLPAGSSGGKAEPEGKEFILLGGFLPELLDDRLCT